MKIYKIYLENHTAEFYSGIADVANKKTERILQDALEKYAEILTAKAFNDTNYIVKKDRN